jgi:hypothetical protein
MDVVTAGGRIHPRSMPMRRGSPAIHLEKPPKPTENNPIAVASQPLWNSARTGRRSPQTPSLQEHQIMQVTSATSRRRRGIRALGAGLAAGAAALAIAAPAGATTMPLAGGATTLRLDAGTGAALTSLGVKVTKAGPAANLRGGFRFPVSGGRIDGSTAAGVINHRGGITLRAGSTRVTLSAFRIITTGTPRIVGKVNGSKAYAPLFTLDLSKAKLDRRGLSTVAGNVGVSLHPRGAAALRGAFGSPAFVAGLKMGTANVVAKPGSAVLTGGGTQFVVADAALGALTSLGIAPGTSGTATLDGATYRFPATGGSVKLSNLAGTITHTGGITLTKGATVVTLADFTIDTARQELWGTVNGSEPVALLKLDLSAPAVSTGAQRVRVGNVPGALTAGAASAPNAAFGTTAFTEGSVLGVADVHGQTA